MIRRGEALRSSPRQTWAKEEASRPVCQPQTWRPRSKAFITRCAAWAAASGTYAGQGAEALCGLQAGAQIRSAEPSRSASFDTVLRGSESQRTSERRRLHVVIHPTLSDDAVICTRDFRGSGRGPREAAWQPATVATGWLSRACCGVVSMPFGGARGQT
jgi:hypothetical protein